MISKIINPRLLAHPVNWLTVWSMVIMFVYVVHLLTHFVKGTHPGSSQTATVSSVAGPGTTAPEYAFT
jgi:hypothetical protein